MKANAEQRHDRELLIVALARQVLHDSPFYDEIVALGRIEAGREDLLQILEARFGPDVAAEFAETVNAIKSEEKLSELHRLALKKRTVNSFRRAFMFCRRD